MKDYNVLDTREQQHLTVNEVTGCSKRFSMSSHDARQVFFNGCFSTAFNNTPSLRFKLAHFPPSGIKLCMCYVSLDIL